MKNGKNLIYKKQKILKYPNYSIDTLGNVFNKKNKKLKPTKRGRGKYFTVHFRTSKQSHFPFIHRLVAETFIPNPENKPTVNHIDGNKYNNSVSNLEWATIKQQFVHAVRLGLNPSKEKHGCAKLNIDNVKFIRKSKLTQRKLAKLFDVSQSTIWGIKNFKSWKNM